MKHIIKNPEIDYTFVCTHSGLCNATPIYLLIKQNCALTEAKSIFFFIHSTIGSAIRCYECNSYNDTKCADDVPPTNLSVECGDHQKGVKYTFCRKIKQIIEFSVNQCKSLGVYGRTFTKFFFHQIWFFALSICTVPADTRIIRGCGWDDTSYKNKCYQRSGFGGRQEVCACDQDNCNGSTSLKSSLAALAMSVLMVIAMKN